jgi:hypothetical protein
MAANPAQFRDLAGRSIGKRLIACHGLDWGWAAARLAALVLVGCMAAAGAAEPAPATAPATQAGAAGGEAKLTWAKFPTEFADYWCTQGLPAQILKPKPDFCRSDNTLLLDAEHTPFATTMAMDESRGTGSGYDTLYVDFGHDGKYIDDPVYRAEPFHGKIGPDRLPVLAYFADVVLPRSSISAKAHVQVFLEKQGRRFNCVMIPQRWATGTMTLGGKTMPAALVDANWDDNVAGLGGQQPDQSTDVAPRGSDYLILGTDGEKELLPAKGARSLSVPGQGGSARGFLTKHLVLDSGTYRLRAESSAGGAWLQLEPAQIPTGTVKLTEKLQTSHLLLIGQSTCVMLSGQATEMAVPADTYLTMNGTYPRISFAVKAGEEKSVDPVPSEERIAALRRAALATRQAGHGSVAQASSSLPADDWTRYVQQFIATYKLQSTQQEQAESILKDVSGRRQEYRTAHKIDYETAGKVDDKAKRAADLQALDKPIDGMFEELKARLMMLPTQAQRNAAAAGSPVTAGAQTQPATR